MPISISGSGTITGISTGGLPDGCIATADLADSAVTQVKLGSGVAQPSYQTFASSGTWTCPTGVTSAIVGVVGGGGGGSAEPGGTGGWGGLGVGLVSVTPGTVYTVTVGAGGTGTDTVGGTGGTSSFGPQGQAVLISATGGTGGTNFPVAGTNGSCSSTAANIRRTIAAYPLPNTSGAATKGGSSPASAPWSITSGLLPGAYGGAGSTAVGSSGGGGGGVVIIQYWN